MSQSDLLLLRLMCSENSQWVVTTHNGHVTAIQKLGPALNVVGIPAWWLEYFVANQIKT